MSHSYINTCNCARCSKEKQRRAAQSASNTAWLKQSAPKQKRRNTEPSASREEQHARYIDSGHNDDIGESPDY